MEKQGFRSRFRAWPLVPFILGLAATLWFLIRVVPKPSRAGYPCMKAAAPLMSSFVLYLVGLSASVFSVRQFRQMLKKGRYLAGASFLILAFLAFGLLMVQDKKEVLAQVLNPVDDSFPVASNQPVGVARGLHPGRVVWVHDPRATNEHYDPGGTTGYWYQDSNCDEQVVQDMLEEALIAYAGTEDLEGAWDAIFKAFNASHGRGEVGYVAGEKIAFKINLTNQSVQWGEGDRFSRMDATPQLLNAILDQLIHVVGVAPADITMGDPYREFRTEYKLQVRNKFPDVYYVDGSGAGTVHQTLPSEDDELYFSDGQHTSTLPQQYLDASYVINIPCLKTHDEGGITLIAKNHQGSFLKMGRDPKGQSAMDMHYSLAKNNRGSQKYRHTVDYMGHEHTGGKGLIYIIDGIWAGESWWGRISKFVSEPFNNDYPSMLLVGQDPVALESVGYDILFQEYKEDESKVNYPRQLKEEIADHLLQCASSAYWPEGISYDPESDGTPLESLGVFEHWNNPTDRQYSRNLDSGQGIELLYVVPGQSTSAKGSPPATQVHLASPNPFMNFTTFTRPEGAGDLATLDIYDLRGGLVHHLPFAGAHELRWDGTNNGKSLSNGVYLYAIRDAQSGQQYAGKVILKR